MRAITIWALFAIMAASSAVALAQPDTKAPMPADAASAATAGPRPTEPMGPGGPGPRHGMGRYGRSYTPGWSMMSAQERDEYRARMQGAQTAEQCRQIRDEHRKLMAERAKERGITLRTPRRDACAGFRK